jgi:hypothetical protein
MRILARQARATEVTGKATETLMHRRVEVTVERESVWVLTSSQPTDDAKGNSCGEDGREATGKELQPQLAQSPAAQTEAPTPAGRRSAPRTSGK